MSMINAILDHPLFGVIFGALFGTFFFAIGIADMPGAVDRTTKKRRTYPLRFWLADRKTKATIFIGFMLLLSAVFAAAELVTRLIS